MGDSVFVGGLSPSSTQASVEAALRAIDRLQAWGVRFVTVEELFRIKGVDVQDGVLYKCPGATHPAAG